MQFRLHTTRTSCAILARLTSIALAALLLAGCQSNSDRDLIARERRQQEDQMWAMQDYIQQYQQLVCRFRSENATLRRQLNEQQTTPIVDQPPVQRMPGSPPRGIQPQSPAPPKVDTPDVPPLNQGTSIDRRMQNRSMPRRGSRTSRDRFVQLTSYEAALNRKTRSGSRNRTNGDAYSVPVPSDVVLSADVVANDKGGGPRLVVDVQPLDQAGRSAPFNGTVSLALLRSENGVQRRIARWDFEPNDVQTAVETTVGGSSICFHVELPADIQLDGHTELWAKVSPVEGNVLFSHAKIDLTKPGLFSSRGEYIWSPQESAVTASYEESHVEVTENTSAADERAEELPVAVNASAWSTAQPGRPAILPPDSGPATGGWKASNQSAASILDTNSSTSAIRPERPKAAESTQPPIAPIEAAKKPSWTPDRPGKQSSTTRPTWSATRNER